MELIKRTMDEIGVPSYDIEQEAYKFATSNGLGNAGVKIFLATAARFKGAHLQRVRQEALAAYEMSTKPTDRIERNTQEATHKIIDINGVKAHAYSGYDLPDPDDNHGGPRGAA
jgi:hypothetical protein